MDTMPLRLTPSLNTRPTRESSALTSPHGPCGIGGSAAFNAVMITLVLGTYLASDAFVSMTAGTSWLAAGNTIACG